MGYTVVLVTDFVEHGNYIIPSTYQFTNHTYGGFSIVSDVFHQRFNRRIWDYLYYAGERSISDTIIPKGIVDSQRRFMEKCIILVAEILKGEVEIKNEEDKDYVIEWLLNYIKWILNGYIIVYYQV